MLRPFAAILIGTTALTACVQTDVKPQPPIEMAAKSLKISGSATYKERMLPPPGSAMVVTLADTGRADAPAVIISEQSIALDNRSVPVSFAFDIPREEIMSNGTYTVRAKIVGMDGTLLWTTDQAHQIDPDATEQEIVPIIMKRVMQTEKSNSDGAGYMETDWKVQSINGLSVGPDSQAMIRFGETGTVSGNTGCNLFSGSYQTENGRVVFSPLAVTKRACLPSIGDQETAFLDALSRIDRIGFDENGNLKLVSQMGDMVRLSKAPGSK